MDCSNILRPCKTVNYALVMKKVSNENSDLTRVSILMENELVTYVEEYFTYGWQSFIGEVGGTFGLFLGFSMLSSLYYSLVRFFSMLT